MNVLKKLIGGGSGKKNSGKGQKKHSKDDDEYDYEADHCETDFDQQFEQARRSTSTSVPPPIMSQCEYRGSPSRGTPTKGSGTISNHRSKSPSPLVHATSTAGRDGSPMQGGNHVKRSSAGSTPGTVRKCSEPNWRTAGKRGSPNLPMGQQLDPNAEMKRKLTQTQQRQAKDIVESIDWIQSAPAIQPQVCYASSNPVQPQVVQSQMIVPQIHICEVLPIVRPGKAIAVIPSATDKRAGGPVQPVSASGKVISGGAINRQP